MICNAEGPDEVTSKTTAQGRNAHRWSSIFCSMLPRARASPGRACRTFIGEYAYSWKIKLNPNTGPRIECVSFAARATKRKPQHWKCKVGEPGHMVLANNGAG